MGKGVLAAAQFAEDIGDATGTAAKAGANITAAAAEEVVSVTTGSLTAFREAWNGVDLLGVNLQVERGTVLVDDATEAADFIDSDRGVQWLPAQFETRHEVAETIRPLSPRTLRGSLTRVRSNVSGSYLELELSSEYVENGYVGLTMGYDFRRLHGSLGEPIVGAFRSVRRSGNFNDRNANTRRGQHSSRSPTWGCTKFLRIKTRWLYTHVVFHAYTKESLDS